MVRTLLVAIVALAAGLLSPPAMAQTWTPIGPPGGNVRALAADPRDPQLVYLGTADGMLYRSEDGGASWRATRPGFPLRRVSLDQVTVDARGTVLVGYWEVQGGGGGVARSADGGRTFTVLEGIRGESVRALAVAPANPQVLAAGTRTGVFFSRHGGQDWTRITPAGDANLRNVESLAFDPLDPRVLYAGTRHLGWKTLDAGATWAPVHGGMIDDSDVMTMTVDHWDPQIIYATACSGVYRSHDGGAAWSKLPGIPFASRRTRAFAQSAQDANLLLAGTTGGLWISEDGGTSWRLSTAGGLVVNTVLVQPDGTILLGTEGAGVLRSSDRGHTWSASNAGFSERFVSRLLFDTAGRRLFVVVWGDGGVFVTPGVSGPWTRLGEGMDGRQALSLARLGGTILAGTDDGVFARAADETVWTRLPTVLDGRDAHPRVTELLAAPPGRILAATTNGLLVSSDAGRTWAQSDIERPAEVYGLAMSPADADIVVAATASGFYRSADGGTRWQLVSPPLPGVTLHALAVLASDDHVVLATTTGGLYRSDDQGTTWRCFTGGLPRSDLSGMVTHPDGRTIYASDFNWGGIFRSVDAGVSWRRMPPGDLPSERVWALGLDPGSPGRVLASSAGGLYLLTSATVAGDAAASP